jgi:trehalose 6-phosphate phosphatase
VVERDPGPLNPLENGGLADTTRVQHALAGGVEFTTTDARERFDSVREHLGGAVIGLDFDGVLAPIVEDPARARIHPRAHQVLVPLARRVRAVAVITGRPARQAISLGGLDDLGH